jgi:aminoglycoside phosphotransferase (APT) family kinase protein
MEAFMSDVELTAVREAHRFDEQALEQYLSTNVENYQGPFRISQFECGQSNPTFKLDTDNQSYVVRKQPPGELLPSAHQVDREHRIMHALQDTGVPVPKTFALCEDSSVIGTKFYVMEMVDGRLFNDTLMGGESKATREGVYLDLVRVLAALHSVDVEAKGLTDFGRAGNYFERQIGRWGKQYIAAQTDDLPDMDTLMKWLPENIPADDTTAIVHGDYRLGNVLIAPDEPKVAAVLDWELCTLGHPLADLGYLCMEYYGVTASGGQSLGEADIAALGIPSEQQMLDEYCKASGRSGIDNWPFYLIFNMFRLAGIAQGVYKRGLDGNASSAKALLFKDAARHISSIAVGLINKQ